MGTLNTTGAINRILKINNSNSKLKATRFLTISSHFCNSIKVMLLNKLFSQQIFLSNKVSMWELNRMRWKSISKMKAMMMKNMGNKILTMIWMMKKWISKNFKLSKLKLKRHQLDQYQ